MNRIAKCERKTKETNISLTLNLDGTGNNKIHTGIGFFDHMVIWTWTVIIQLKTPELFLVQRYGKRLVTRRELSVMAT